MESNNRLRRDFAEGTRVVSGLVLSYTRLVLGERSPLLGALPLRRARGQDGQDASVVVATVVKWLGAMADVRTGFTSGVLVSSASHVRVLDRVYSTVCTRSFRFVGGPFPWTRFC
jgi:hypothetical protein